MLCPYIKLVTGATGGYTTRRSPPRLRGWEGGEQESTTIYK